MHHRLVVLALFLAASPASAQFPISLTSSEPGEIDVSAIEHAPDGSFYALGTFESDLTIGSATEPVFSWSAPNPNGWLARFQADGSLAWAYPLGARRAAFRDQSTAYPKRLVVLDDGSVVILGTLSLGIEIDLDFGEGETIVPAPELGTSRAFIARYDPEGDLVWSGVAVLAGNLSYAEPLGLDADEGIVYTLLPSTRDADPGEAVVPTGGAALVALQASDGATVYVQNTDAAGAAELAVADGNAYVLNVVGRRFRIAGHDASDGAAVWAYRSSTGDDGIERIAVDADGRLYGSGRLSTSATGAALDPSDPSTLTLSRNGDQKSFLVSYAADGTFRWAERTTTGVELSTHGIAVDGGEVVQTGFTVFGAYATTDGSLVRAAPASLSGGRIRTIAVSGDLVTAFTTTRPQGVPEGTSTRSILRLRRSDFEPFISPPVFAEDSADRGPLALSASPNPSSGVVRIEVASAGSVRVEVFDMVGRRVTTLHDGPAPGPLLLDATALAPGVYTVRALTSTETATRMVSIVR